MPFPDYEIQSPEVGGTFCESDLHAEIVGSGPYSTNFIGVSVTGGSVKVIFDEDPNSSDKLVIDGVLAAHDQTLQAAKTAKAVAIDTKTSQLIDGGFVYSEKTFSLSLDSQAVMAACQLLKDDGSFVYPVKMNNIDNTDVYSVVDSVDMNALYVAAITAMRSFSDSGTALKDAVRAAINVAEVDAVIDNR